MPAQKPYSLPRPFRCFRLKPADTQSILPDFGKLQLSVEAILRAVRFFYGEAAVFFFLQTAIRPAALLGQKNAAAFLFEECRHLVIRSTKIIILCILIQQVVQRMGPTLAHKRLMPVPSGVIHQRKLQCILSIILQQRAAPQEGTGDGIYRIQPGVREPAVRICHTPPCGGHTALPARFGRSRLKAAVFPKAIRITCTHTESMLRVGLKPAKKPGHFLIRRQTRRKNCPFLPGCCCNNGSAVKFHLILQGILHLQPFHYDAVEIRLRPHGVRRIRRS